MIEEFCGQKPVIGEDTFVADNTVVLGAVTVGRDCCVLFGVVMRSDSESILIGDRTNIQDNAVIHVGWGFGVRIGNEVTVGHGVILHGCTIEDGCLIGMGAILMNGCLIGANSLIAAGTLIKENTVIPPGSVVAGSPGRVVRQVTDKDLEYLRHAAEEYVDFGRRMREKQQEH